MVAGRTLLGLGAESQIVAVTVALARWFKGKELSFAFGINLDDRAHGFHRRRQLAHLGEVRVLSQRSRRAAELARPLILAVVVGSTAVIGAVVYWALESYAEGRYSLGKSGEPDKLSFPEGLKFNPSYWYVVATVLHFLLGNLPFPTFAIDLFTSKILLADGRTLPAVHGGLRRGTETGRLLQQRPSLLRHDRHSAVRSAGRQDRQARHPHGAWFVPHDAGVPDDRVQQHFAVGTGVDDGHRFLADPRGHVAVGGLHRQRAPAGHRLRPHEPAAADRHSSSSIWPSAHANDISHAGPENFHGYALGMWIFSILGFLALFFALLLRQRETGPDAHGLETITTATGVERTSARSLNGFPPESHCANIG